MKLLFLLVTMLISGVFNSCLSKPSDATGNSGTNVDPNSTRIESTHAEAGEESNPEEEAKEEAQISASTDNTVKIAFYKKRFVKIEKNIAAYQKYYKDWKIYIQKNNPQKDLAAKKWAKILGTEEFTNCSSNNEWYCTNGNPPTITSLSKKNKKSGSVIERIERLFNGTMRALGENTTNASVTQKIAALKSGTKGINGQKQIENDSSIEESIKTLLDETLQEMKNASSSIRTRIGITE